MGLIGSGVGFGVVGRHGNGARNGQACGGELGQVQRLAAEQVAVPGGGGVIGQVDDVSHVSIVRRRGHRRVRSPT